MTSYWDYGRPSEGESTADLFDKYGIKEPDLSKPMYRIRPVDGVPGLFRASRPGYPQKIVRPKDLQDGILGFTEDGITDIFCLLSDAEYFKYYGLDLVEYYKRRKFKVHRFPIPDFGVPRVEFAFALAKAMFDALESGKRVLVHCSAGQGRTGLAINLLIEYRNRVRGGKKFKTGTVETTSQQSFLPMFRRHLTKKMPKPKKPKKKGKKK